MELCIFWLSRNAICKFVCKVIFCTICLESNLCLFHGVSMYLIVVVSIFMKWK